MEIRSNYFIDFRPQDSIGNILGFSAKLLEPKKLHSSDLPVNIIKVPTIHIDSNITAGAGDKPSHNIYEFAVGVDPDFAIAENTVTLNQDSITVNFGGEEIIVRL